MTKFKKYRKRPIVIEAALYEAGLEDGFNVSEKPSKEFWLKNGEDGFARPFIKTSEGKVYVSQGDYVIRGRQGEKSLCTSDVFKQTYDPVDNYIADGYQNMVATVLDPNQINSYSVRTIVT